MPKYNGYTLPELPERDTNKYPIAFITVYPGEYAYLVFADKQAFVADVDNDGSRTYTFLQTNQDEYDDSKMIYAREFVIGLSAPIPDYLTLVWPGINTSAWLELEWESNQDIPEGSFYAISCGSGPHWSNTTLYDVDGNVVIEASEPAAERLDLKSWLIGFALGLAGKPLPLDTSVDAVLMDDGVLYVRKAGGQLRGDVLEVM